KEDEFSETFVRSDFSLRSTSTANTTKHINASPPMTPLTIAPVLLVRGIGVFGTSGTLGFEGKAPRERTVAEDGVGLVGDEEIEEDVDDGEKGDGLGREERAARDVEDPELGVGEANKCSVLAPAAQAM
ncbi:MAG: hypothetical protein Q9214_005483, partial [Letrouitia sp. 1 TL-2023]